MPKCQHQKLIAASGDSKALLKTAEKAYSYIFSAHVFNDYHIFEPKEISEMYFRANVGQNYVPALQLLKKTGIVRCNESYSKEHGRAKSYALTPGISTEIDCKILERSRTRKKEYIIKRTGEILQKITIDYEGAVQKINELTTYETTRQEVKIGDEIPDGSYYVKYGLEGDRSEAMYSLHSIKTNAALTGNQIHLYSKKTIIATRDTDRLIFDIASGRKLAYTRSIELIKDLPNSPGSIVIGDGKNGKAKNGRLYHCIANTKTELLKYVRLNGEQLVSLDLSNSQFALLSRVMETITKTNQYRSLSQATGTNIAIPADIEDYKRLYAPYIAPIEATAHLLTTDTGQPLPDVQKFIETAYKGRFYEWIMQELWATRYAPQYGIKTFADLETLCREGLNNRTLRLFNKFDIGLRDGRICQPATYYQDIRERTRKDAKGLMFLLMFSSERFNPIEKQQLSEIMPNVVAFCNAFKKLAGSNQLAIMLQSVESEIFIMRILYRLLKGRLNAISKHDSILIPASEYLQAKDKVLNVLNEYIGRGKFQLKEEVVENKKK